MTAHDDRRDRVDALNARDDLLAIAHHWPHIVARLANTGNTANEPVTGSHAQPLIINLDVSETLTIISAWVRHLATILRSGTSWQPTTTHTPALLADIARHHIGHFTQHPNPATRRRFLADAADMRHRAQHTANPTHRKRIHIPLPCPHTNPNNTPCPGHMTATLRDDHDDLPDLICTHNPTHHIPPSTWTRPKHRPLITPETATHNLLNTLGLDQT
jgi:hypothetical protein